MEVLWYVTPPHSPIQMTFTQIWEVVDKLMAKVGGVHLILESLAHFFFSIVPFCIYTLGPAVVVNIHPYFEIRDLKKVENTELRQQSSFLIFGEW